MVKAAPAVVRATDVLDFFVARPGRPFTLSEVAEALGVRPGTLLTILLPLTDRGYLARHPRHKTYVLGPALVAAGHAALLPHPIVDVARHELPLIAERTGLECAATLAIGNHLVLVASAGRSTRTDPTLVWMGAHLPLQRPFGATFVAWADDEDIDRWIGAEYQQRSPDGADRLRLMLARARAQGYTLGFASSRGAEPLSRAMARAWGQSRSAGTQQGDGTHTGRVAEAMIDDTGADPLRAEIDTGIEQLSDQTVALNLGERPLADATSVVVPVFGRAGEVALVLTAHGFPEQLTTESLDRLVDQLTGCATLITKGTFARGRR